MKQMNIHFYDNYIDLADVRGRLEQYSISEEEISHLLHIARKSIHLEITQFILNELDHTIRTEMVVQLEYFPHEKATELLVLTSVPHFDQRVSVVIDTTKKDLIERLFSVDSGLRY